MLPPADSLSPLHDAVSLVDGTAAPADPQKTLELLWSRVQQRGDLPGFAKVVSTILSAMRGEQDRDFNMTRTVLADPSLTQKVLRLANSPMYAVFGQEITTITNAVSVLGIESVGHLALGLKLIDGLTLASPDSVAARQEMEKAVLSGHIGRQVASLASTRDAEEARVCAMLHGLGRMMVAFYLSDLWQQIQRAVADKTHTEDAIVQQVLGLRLEQIGIQAAQKWGLPQSLILTLQHIDPASLDEPLDHGRWLAAVSTLSLRCADILFQDEPNSAVMSAAVQRLTHDYANMLGIDAVALLAAVNTASRAERSDAANAEQSVITAQMTDIANNKIAGKPPNAARLMASGVLNMEKAAQTASTAQLMSMGLETVYKSFGFSHAVIFQRVPKEGRYLARLCLGGGLQDIAEQMAFDDAYQPDVFHAALSNDKMVFVENARDPTFVNKLPRWWKDALPNARSFIVMPMSVDRRPVGFLYADWDVANAEAQIDADEVRSLHDLRALLIRVLEQQRKSDRLWGRGQG